VKKRTRRPQLWAWERTALGMGFKVVAGVDEVGLGPLAGPVVAGAAVLPLGARLPGLDDSKKLTHVQRLVRARQLAMERAVAALGLPVEYLLLDAFDVPESPLPQLAVVKGDSTCASIMAASIVAKVHRDLQMIEFDGQFPGYGFALHKGYATFAHQEAIRFLGPSPIHRTSWRRVRELASGAPNSRKRADPAALR
jgi:ribonuclease HII